MFTLSKPILISLSLSLLPHITTPYIIPSLIQTPVLQTTNAYRVEHGVNPLLWSDQLAVTAQSAISSAALAQNELQSGPGLNVAVSAPGVPVTAATFKSLVQSWYEQGENYNYGIEIVDLRGSEEEPSPFTQLVWKNSTEVGCGASINGQSQTTVVTLVCKYSPPGNTPGSFGDNVFKPQPAQNFVPS